MRGRRDHVRLDADVGQPRHRRRRIVGVQRRQHEVAGLRGLHRDAGGLLVADFADQDHVGVLAQDRAQRARERQLDLLVDLRLVDARQLVLDRIFDGDDVGALGLQRHQRRAERGGLAAAGRPDDEDHAVLVFEEAPCRSLNAAAEKPELLERRHAAVLIEDAQHHLLAVQRAQRRGAEVDVLAVFVGDADAAVLRQALLGDVHARHDLQARDQSFVDPLRQVHHFFQQAVEAMADEDALFHRLDVHVRRAGLDRALHDQIDEVDDRRGFAAFLQPGDRLEAAVFVGAARQRLVAGRRVRPCARVRRHLPGRRRWS